QQVLARVAPTVVSAAIVLAIGLPGLAKISAARASDPVPSPTAPAVELTVPADPLRGDVALTASASASVGRTIDSVVFERSPVGSGQWTPIATDTEPPFTATFATSAVPDGSY